MQGDLLLLGQRPAQLCLRERHVDYSTVTRARKQRQTTLRPGREIRLILKVMSTDALNTLSQRETEKALHFLEGDLTV